MGIRPPPREPLYEAIFQRDTAAVESLIRNGTTDVSLLRPDGQTPILFAVACIRRCIEKETLTAALPNPQRTATVPSDSGGGGMLPTPSSAAVAILQLLIDAGADVNKVKAGWATALRIMVVHSTGAAVELDVARRLIAAGAVAYEIDDGYADPSLLILAVIKGLSGMVDLLLPHTPIAAINALYSHTYKHHLGGTGYLTQTPLYFATYFRKHTHIVASLLAAGADAETENCNLYEAACHNYTDVAKLLIEHGADVNRSEPYHSSETPLRAAAQHGGVPLVTLLLDAGADPLQTDSYGVSPLYMAVVKGRTAIVRLLYHAGADPNCPDKLLRSPLFIAASHGNAEITDLLLEAGADPLPADDEGVSPLYRAVVTRNTAIVRLLCHAGADPNCPDKYLQSPLFIAVSNGDAEIVSLLLEAGADPLRTDDEGVSPLHKAVEERNTAIVRLLCHAVTNCPDNFLRSPLSIAVSNHDTEIVKLLREAGAKPERADRKATGVGEKSGHTLNYGELHKLQRN